jgi:hypothetical protein
MAKQTDNQKNRHRPPILLLAVIIAMAFLAFAAVSSAGGEYIQAGATRSAE